MSNAPATAGASALATIGPHEPVVIGLDPEALIAKAIDAQVSVESLERLLRMRAELRREQAAAAFSRSLAQFQAQIPAIPKRQTATVRSKNGGSYSYNYADIADIQRAIAPRLADCGLSVTFDTTQAADVLTVACIVHHIDGHSERASFPVPIDRAARMNASQQLGSALTYGRRYALCAALGIVTAEDDDDSQSAYQQQPAGNGHDHNGAQRPSSRGTAPDVHPSGAPQSARQSEAPNNEPRISEAQHRRLEARIHELRLDRERVKAWCARAFGVAHFPELTRQQYARLDGRLEVFATAQRTETPPADEPPPMDHGDFWESYDQARG